MRSVEAAATQVVGDDDVGDRVKDKLNVVCVSGTRLVTVDLLCRALVLCLKLRLDVCCSFLIALLAYITTSSLSLQQIVVRNAHAMPDVSSSYACLDTVVCVLVMNLAKKAEPIKILFGFGWQNGIKKSYVKWETR